VSGLSKLFKSGRKALIGYVTVGYPDLAATRQAAAILAGSGWDALELGIPFSDPMADGVTIQQASFEALKRGVTPADCLGMARDISRDVNIPLIFMGYFNPVMSYGVERFCQDAAKAGVGGLIIPDLTPDEGGLAEKSARQNGLDLVYLLAPNASEKRIRLIVRRSTGFIYLVSLTGVTGARQGVAVGLGDFISRVRRQARPPLCVGFGISNPEQAREVANMADGVIVGSRIVQIMGSGPGWENELEKMAREMRSVVDRG
jgi:tryptophan synthase alpha chain